MAKTFITSGIGASQTLDAIQNEKVPVYNTRADAEADIANIVDDGIVFTKDTGATEKVVDVVEDGNMNPVTSNAVADCLKYSTNETVTGKTWIDGKPIYRIVLTTTASITNTANSWGGLQTVISNLNLERCVYVVVASSGGGNFPILFTRASGFRTYDSNVAEAGVNIIFEYTKTTD